MKKNKKGDTKMLWLVVSMLLILAVGGTLLYNYLKAYGPFSQQTSEVLNAASRRLCPLGVEIGTITGEQERQNAEYRCNPCLGATNDIDEDGDGMVVDCDEDDKNPRKFGCKKGIAHNKNDKAQCCVAEVTYGYITCVA